MDMTVEVPELPELTFDEASHIYRLNGDIIPSVSKLMEPLKDQCYGGMKASGICEVRKNKHYPRAGTPLYCCQSKKACLDFDERGERPIRYQEA